MSEDMPERMSKDMSQRMSEDMPEDITERLSKDIHVYINGTLWMASCLLFHVAHCSKYCWLNFLCASK